MKFNTITLSWTRYTDADFLNKAQHILESMTGNPAFTDPIPTLADLKTAITNYSTALIAAADLGRNNVAVKNMYRDQLEMLLKQLGMYVMYVANGDATVLISSGYTLAKEPEPVALANPGLVVLSNGITSGQLVAMPTNTKGANSFLHQICDAPPTEDTVWDSTPSSRSKHVFTNLIPGKQYWVRIAATGSERQIAYSAIATQFVQ